TRVLVTRRPEKRRGPAPPSLEGPGLVDLRPIAIRRGAWSLGPDLREGLGLLDDLLLEPRGDLLILEELHAEAPLALGRAAEVVRVAEHLGERDLGDDYRVARPRLGAEDDAPLRGQGAGDRPLELGRDLDLDLHDRLEQDRLGLLEGLAEAV